MTFTKTPVSTRTASIQSEPIDHMMASSIIDRLGFTLQDLSLEYGDVVISGGDISHQLWYDSVDGECTIIGYVNVDNDIYYASGNNNYSTAQQAALELLDWETVDDCRYTIELERAIAVDYM